MAIPKRIEFTHDYVFSSGAYLVSEVRQMNDFDRSTRGEQDPADRQGQRSAGLGRRRRGRGPGSTA